jgi:hypothetical protein
LVRLAERGGEDGAALVEQQAVAELARFNLANEHQDVLTRRDLGRGQVGEKARTTGRCGDGTTISGTPGPHVCQRASRESVGSPSNAT